MSLFQFLSDPLARFPGPVRGALWMVMSGACFASMTAVIRHLSVDMHAFEIVFFRNALGLVFLLPWLWRGGLAGVRTRRIGLHGLRMVIGLVTMLCWFSAVTMMPIAEATALSFTAPLFGTVGAALVLGEAVRTRRWVATAVGFAGAMIILRPGIEALSLPAFLVLASSACMAVGMMIVKTLSRTDSATVIVLYMGLGLTPLSLGPALLVWETPTPSAWFWLFGLGALATLGHLMFVRAMASGEASAVLPFDFSRLIFAAALGFAVFGQQPDVWTWIGAAVIFAAALFTASREAKARPPAAERPI
jgi:drug/metabolite transporter (DMT)-like permease